MAEEPSIDLIRYDVLTQDAMRGVVKMVITEAAKAGLPGDHHFFISFITGHPGVRLSTRMRERYPDEMTIVVQHQFWDLKATDNNFEIGLSFDEIPEKLSIPFSAIKGFFDPSVQFGLQFDIDDDEETANGNVTAFDASEPAPPPGKVKSTETAVSEIRAANPPDNETEPKKKPGKTKKSAKPRSKADESDQGSAEVVSLDAFRKKP